MTMTGEYRTAYGHTCPSSTLSTTDLIWIDLGSNSGLCCERSVINHLDHGRSLV